MVPKDHVVIWMLYLAEIQTDENIYKGETGIKKLE